MTETRSYADLPDAARAAVAQYVSADCETPEEVLAAVEDVSFTPGLISARDLVEMCWRAPDNMMRHDFPDWTAYHDWYWATENDADYRDHLTEMWPVILCDNEGILDGWHRFHWYLRQGVDMIPTLRMT